MADVPGGFSGSSQGHFGLFIQKTPGGVLDGKDAGHIDQPAHGFWQML